MNENYKIDGDTITITFTKRELEYAKNHFCKAADKYKPKKDDEKFDFRYPYYIGRADAYVNLLKLFEPIDDAL